MGVARELRKLSLGAPLVAAIEVAARARGAVGAQLGVREDQPRLVQFWEGPRLYARADDVQLHTVNPLTLAAFHDAEVVLIGRDDWAAAGFGSQRTLRSPRKQVG